MAAMKGAIKEAARAASTYLHGLLGAFHNVPTRDRAKI
jgi:hypothetical protein